MASDVSDADILGFRTHYAAHLVARYGPNPRFRIKAASSDSWGIILKQDGMPTGVHIKHHVEDSALDLSLFAKSLGVLGGAFPPDAVNRSTPKTDMFRVAVPQMSYAADFAGQKAALDQVLDSAEALADWFFAQT